MKTLTYYNRVSPLLNSYLLEVQHETNPDGDTVIPTGHYPVSAVINALDGSRWPVCGLAVDPQFLTERVTEEVIDDSPAQSLYGKFLRDFSVESDGMHFVFVDYELCSTVCVKDTTNVRNVLNLNLYDETARSRVRAAVVGLCQGDVTADDAAETVINAAGLSEEIPMLED